MIRKFAEWSAYRENQGLAQMSSSGNTPMATQQTQGTGTEQLGSDAKGLGAAKAKFIAFLNNMPELKDKAKRDSVMNDFLAAFVQQTGLNETQLKTMIGNYFRPQVQPAQPPQAQANEPQAGGAAQKAQQPPSQQSAQASSTGA